MEFKEMLRKMSFHYRTRQNEEEEIKAEENNIIDVLSNVSNK